MLKLEGTLLSKLSYPARGERPGYNQIQILVDFTTKNGDVRHDLINLTVDDLTNYKEGTFVSIPVSAYVRGNAVGYFVVS